MKQLHLGANNRSVVESRDKTKHIEFGIKRAMEFEINDEIKIFVEKEPLADGIIKNVTITSISSVINELFTDEDTKGKTPKQLLDSLNEKYEKILGRKVKVKDPVSVIEWIYK